MDTVIDFILGSAMVNAMCLVAFLIYMIEKCFKDGEVPKWADKAFSRLAYILLGQVVLVFTIAVFSH